MGLVTATGEREADQFFVIRLRHQALEPSLGAKAAPDQRVRAVSGVRILDMGRERPSHFGNGGHVLGLSRSHAHVASFSCRSPTLNTGITSRFGKAHVMLNLMLLRACPRRAFPAPPQKLPLIPAVNTCVSSLLENWPS